MSRQNSDSVIAGGLGSSLGGVLNGIWGTHRSAEVSPVVENPPPGPATAAFESTLETIHDVEVPGGFGGEREWGAPAPAQEVIPEPVIVPPSPPKLEEPKTVKVQTPNAEIVNFPTPEPAETVPQTPNEPEQSVLSVADRKKSKKQRDKERKEREAQEKREREEREAQEKKEREEKKQQEKAERDARKRKEREEREEWERLEQERIAREAQEQAEREAKEQADREAEKQARREVKRQAEREAREQAERETREQAEREAKEQADREAERQARREAKKQAEREAREQAEREAREQAEHQARAKSERETKERAERIERAEREAREAQEQAEREARERAEKVAKDRMDKVSRRRADREATKEAEEKAKREAKEKADEAARVKAEKQKTEKEARERAEQEARETAEREAREKEEKRLKREEEERIEKERIENQRIEWEKKEAEAREKAEREAREREEEERKKLSASRIPSAWGSTVGKNGDRSRKTSSISPKEQKNEWGSNWGFGSTEKKEESSNLPPIITSSVPGGIFEGAGHFDFFTNKDSPGGGGGGGGSEEVELRTPLTKKGKDAIHTPSNLPKAATPTENTDLGKLDMFEDMGLNNINNMSARVSVSSENERFTDAEQGPASPAETVQPAFAPEVALEALPNPMSELLNTPQAVKEEAKPAPTSWPLPPSNPTLRRTSISAPAPAPIKTETEKPLSLWERKKLKTATLPTTGSDLLGGGDATNSSDPWGEANGGKKTETIAMPNLTGTGDRQSIFTDTARDQKRENQRETVVEGLLGSNQTRRRIDSAQSQIPAKPTTKPAPAPPQKSSGWGSWGTSLLNTVASAVNSERTPSPEPPPVKPKIEDPPRGFTPSLPPKSQPVAFGSSNKPASAWGGAGDNAWGGAMNGPPPIAQKTSAGPAWGAKPNSGFGSGGTTWGNPTGPTFSSAMSRNLTVDTAKKPLESGPNTAGPENIPESAVEIKHVPAPGGFDSSIFDKKEDVVETQGGWGFEELGEDKGLKKNSKETSPVREKAPEEPVPADETEEPVKTEETATPAEEDEFDWAPAGKKKKKGQVVSVSQTPSVPNTPDPDNGDEGGPIATSTKKKKGKKGKK